MRIKRQNKGNSKAKAAPFLLLFNPQSAIHNQQ